MMDCQVDHNDEGWEFMAIKYGRPIEYRPHPVEAEAPRTTPLELTTRMRRNRKSEWRHGARHVLTADDLIWPLSPHSGANVRVPVASMPGVAPALGRSGGARGRARR